MINHIMLQLRPTAEKEQALQQFINDIQDPSSPLFHHWITAAEFGQRYGVAPADVAKVTDWLESRGFKVNFVYPNQMVIDFTGSAGQIRQAFYTEIHNLMVNGQTHIANMRDPQIPAALASSVAGVVSLNDFRPHPTLQSTADYSVGKGNYLVVPADLWTIYNFNPAFAAGISGQGQTIVAIEDTDLYTTADWDNFRSVLGLASTYPLGSLTQVHPNNCADPGVNGDDVEAAVDVEWASAGAPSAAIELASCSSTEANWGGFIALQNLLNESGTPPAIVSISYGDAEPYLGSAFNESISSLYQQAVTEGVSVFVSSGDSGAAMTDADSNHAQYGISVSGFTSTPYNVSVGGTDFADTYEHLNSTYWNSTDAANYGSALSYIPEIPWNDSCASVLIGDFLGVLPTYGSDGLCNDASDVATYRLLNTIAGSGGPSGCATGTPDFIGVSGTCAGYAKPSWQSGMIGNPSDGVRDIPDVSLFAANGAWGHYYVACFSDPNNHGKSCSNTPDKWAGFGGTSLSSPIMAAIQSLINQASRTRWGNPNPAYYSLAATEYGSGGNASCNSALGNTVASDCIFYDVAQIPLLYTGVGTGGDNDVPCSGMNCYLPSGRYGVFSAAPQTLSSVMVVWPGSGFSSVPSCTLSGGGGSGATCSASLTGIVSTISLPNSGVGYTTNPTCTLTGGGGVGARCTVMTCNINGTACNAVVTNFGHDYTSAPVCTISGGGGTGATCTASITTGIEAIDLLTAGTDFTSLPGCAISGGGGVNGACAAQAVNTSDNYQPAFGAATGWDFATGIGTVNASNLVASFSMSSATLSARNVTFSPQTLYTSSAAQSVTVTNTGTANLNILLVTIGGTNATDFAKSADTCTGATVIPNGACTVSVTFTPSAAGSLSASLNFADVAPKSPQTVTLSGSGTGVSVSLSPSSLTFMAQLPATSSTAQTVTLANTGNMPLTLTSISITGSNSGDFTQNNTCGTTVGGGENCAIEVTFTPAATGSKSGALTIVDNALDSPQQAIITGTGAIPLPFINQPLVPTNVAPGGSGFTLAVNGTGFVSGATVNWNGVALATTFVSAEEITATVPSANITSPGTAWVTVVNPGSSSISNTIFFPVTASVPTIDFGNASGSPVATGPAPDSIVVGDFNGDGKLDLAVVNVDGSVTILLGNGDGTFTPAALSPSTGGRPSSVALGDFNGDGKLDLAVVNVDGSVTILLGNGDGTFTPAASSPSAGGEPSSVAVGDFNRDGKLDLAVAYAGSNIVTIFLGNGDGTFTPAASSPPTGLAPSSIAVGDFNGDGKLDLAVANLASSNVTILLGNGNGTFTPAASSPPTESIPSSIVVGDFNGDGKLDLAVVNSGSNNVTILLGNGDGTFTRAASAPSTGAAPSSGAAGDFNGDGKLDLAVVNSGSNNVTILLGNGDGTFTPAASSPPTESIPSSIVVGDFNGDGRLDLAIVNAYSNNVSVMLQVPPQQMASVSPGSLTFGNQNLGTTSGPQLVTLSNTGGSALTVTGITPSANFGQTNNCGSSLAAGDSCTISVTFAPTTTGTLNGTLTIADNNNGLTGSTQTVTLSGTGTAPGVSLSPASVTFGNQLVGTTSAASAVTVTNNGTASLSFTNIAAAGDFAVAAGGTTCSTTAPVAASGSCVINVTFTPTATGSRSGSLTLSDNANGSMQTVSLSGTGTAPGISLSTTSVSFGNQPVGKASAASAVTVTNSGTAPLSFTSLAATGDFAIAAGGTTCSTSSPIAASASCLINVTFTPTATGSRSGSLTLTDNASGSPQTVSLSGTGTAPGISLSTTSVSFGNEQVGTTSTASAASTASAVTVTNNGTASLTFTSIAATGDFAVAAGGTTCSTTAPVAASGSCVINVTFTPTATGSRSGSLTLSDNANGSMQTVSLSGTGTAPGISLSTTSVSFGNQPVGKASAASAVTVTNSGTAPLSFTSLAATGDFAIAAGGTTCSTSSPIAASASCLINVTFTPTATGSRSGSLTLTDNASGSPQTVSLSGTGTAPGISLSTTSVSFGNEQVGTTSAASAVTVTNNGTVSLSFTSIAAAGDFAVAASGTTCSTTAPVAASGSCLINVTFTPTATGSRSGSLTLTDNASGSPQTVSLSGTGTAPGVSLSPASVTFGNQPVGTASAASAVTVTNNGTASLSFTNIAAAGDFAVATSGTTCSTTAPVAASGSCVINVTFTPTATGSRSGSLTLTDNASGSAQTVSLSGTGTPSGPAVSLSSSSLTFAVQVSGTSSTAQSVTLTNTGISALTISGITASGDFSATNACGTSVAAGANCSISVTFKPTAGGTRTGTLSISDNASGSPQSVALSGTGQDFSFAPPSGSSASATVAPGSPATYTLSVGGEGGLSGTVNFTCTGAPSEATCTVSPNPLMAGSSTTNVTVTITTTAPSISAPRSRPLPPVPPLLPGAKGLLMLTLALAAMAWALWHQNQPSLDRWQSTIVPLALGLLLALALAGCAGGGKGGVSLTPNSGTPLGTYILTVTASTGSGSSALSHSFRLTLNVG
jgi:hypothetical protein